MPAVDWSRSLGQAFTLPQLDSRVFWGTRKVFGIMRDHAVFYQDVNLNIQIFSHLADSQPCLVPCLVPSLESVHEHHLWCLVLGGGAQLELCIWQSTDPKAGSLRAPCGSGQRFEDQGC